MAAAGGSAARAFFDKRLDIAGPGRRHEGDGDGQIAGILDVAGLGIGLGLGGGGFLQRLRPFLGADRGQFVIGDAAENGAFALFHQVLGSGFGAHGT